MLALISTNELRMLNLNTEYVNSELNYSLKILSVIEGFLNRYGTGNSNLKILIFFYVQNWMQ